MQLQSRWVLGWSILNIIACSLSIQTPRCKKQFLAHYFPHIYYGNVFFAFSWILLAIPKKHVAVFLIAFSLNAEPFWKIKQSALMQQIPPDLSAKQCYSSCQHKPFCACRHPYIFVERHISGGLSFCPFSKKTRGANKFEAINHCFKSMKINPKKVVLGPWVTDPFNRS